MGMSRRHRESRPTDRIGWRGATGLGANDGIVSITSPMVGVAAAGLSHASMPVAGVTGLLAGAVSMAADEYISVHAQADTERAELSRERKEPQLIPPGDTVS